MCYQLIWTYYLSIDKTQLAFWLINWQVVVYCQLISPSRNRVLSIDKYVLSIDKPTSHVNWQLRAIFELNKKPGLSIDNTAWKSVFVNWEVNLVISIDMNMFLVNWPNSICVFAYQLTSPHLFSIDNPVEKSRFINWQTCFINWQTYKSC